MDDCDVVVVGAGVAGLAAAGALRRARLRVTLIEAGSRIGGRAHTIRPAALGGTLIDAGASWLHMADRNPIVPLARAAGETLNDPPVRNRIAFVDGHRITAEERAAFDSSETRFHDFLADRIARGLPDESLAEAASGLGADPWVPTLLFWEASLIAAADPRDLGRDDWHLNLLDGVNLQAPGGIGDLVGRVLGTAAGPVHLATPATRIAWGGRGVTVDTPRGTIAARACIVTVSTGVLGGGAIRFDPALPDAAATAIEQLPMGLLSKVALRAAGADRLGLPASCGVYRCIAGPDDAALSMQFWPQGEDHMLGYFGGRTSWQIAREGPGAAEDFARGQIRAVFGADADRAFRPGAMETGWGTDPLFRGAYAYAGPGHAGARSAMARPLGEGRLAFAGEAWRDDGFAGTVGGAFRSGEAAATAIAAALLVSAQ